MKANRKFRDGEEAVSAVIGVILMVAITVAIAATVYVYVTGMIQTGTTQAENAGVVAKGDTERVRVILSQAGQNMPAAGYGGTITVEGTPFTVTTWTVGEAMYIGSERYADGATLVLGAETSCFPGDYAVTVSVMDTVVYDGVVTVS